MSAPLRYSLALLLAVSLTACPKKQPQLQQPIPSLTPLPQDPFIEAYFNQSQASTYIEPYRHQSRLGNDLEQIIVDTISGAKSRVDVAVQELRLPKVAQALVERHQAGVKVRVIIENSYSRPTSSLTEAKVIQLSERERDRYQEFIKLADTNTDGEISQEEINQRDALVMLANAGVPWIDDTADGSQGTGLMHHKFVVVDGQTTIITSANFTTSGIHGDFSQPSSRGNANNLLKIQNPELADLFTEEFQIMWGDGPGGKDDSKFGVKKPFRPMREVTVGNTKVGVQFAPTSKSLLWEKSVNGSIDKILNRATESIDLALFVFSSQELVNTLQVKQARGVLVRGLIDPSFAYRFFSEGLDMMGVAVANNCKYEAGNNPWKNPIYTVGVPNMPPGDRLHHKLGIIDGKIAIAGSHNWSENANYSNDETLLIIENPTVVAHFKREFNRLYNSATLGVPARVIQQAQKQQEKCVIIAEIPGRLTSSSEKINLNTASQKELERLPGVGVKLARRIIEAREEKPFKSLEDLDLVPGIGPKMLDKLSDRVTW